MDQGAAGLRQASKIALHWRWFLLMRWFLLILAGLITLFTVSPTHAQDITRTWYLDNVRFDSGAVATGSFDYNTNPYNPLGGLYGTYSNININVTSQDGTVREFRRVNPASRGNECYISIVAADPFESDVTGAPFMALTLPGINPGDSVPNPNCMSNAGGVLAILPGPANLSYLGTCRNANCGPADGPYEEALSGGRLIAGPQVWRLDNVRFDSGAVATGSFVYDEEPYAPLAGQYGTYSNININVTSPGGTVREFRRVNPASRGNECYLSLVAADPAESDLSGAPFMALTLPGINPGDTVRNPNCMSNAGGTLAVLPGPTNLSYLGTCRNANCGPADAPYEEARSGGRLISNPGPQRWYLENITFDSGAIATGYFDYDELPYNQLAGQYGRFSNININVTSMDGTVREFRRVNPASRGNEAYLSMVAAGDDVDDLTGRPFLALTTPGNPAISALSPSPLALNNLGGVREVLPGPSNLSYLGTCRQANCGPADGPYEEANAGGRFVTEIARPNIVSDNSATIAEGQVSAIDVQSTDDRDAEGAGLIYSKSGGADDALFNVDINSGVATFINAPDYDNPTDADGNNIYDLQVTVTDSGGQRDVQDIAVTVVKVNTWRLLGVQLSDGRTLSGSFKFAAAINQYSNVNISLNDDTGTSYNLINPGVTPNSSTLSLLNQLISDQTGGLTLRFTFATALTDSGGTVDILTNVPFAFTLSALATCFNADCSTYTTPLLPMSGRVTTLIDEAAPTSTPTFEPMANAAGWYNANVTVSWNWTDGASGSGIDPNNCQSTFTFTGEGPQAVVGQCTDLAGNLGLQGSGSVNIDRIPPETNITATPSASGVSTNASFEFSGIDVTSGVESYQCQLDGGLFVDCTSPTLYSGFSAGNHSFQVRAIDVAGNADPTPASFTWTILQPDVTAPTATPVLTPAANAAGWNNSEFTVNWNWTDEPGGSGVDAQNCLQTTEITQEGRLNPQAFCSDLAGNGNIDQIIVRLDRIAPDTSIDVSPPASSMSGDATFEFSGSDSSSAPRGASGVASFECTFGNGTFTLGGPCTSPQDYSALTEGTYTFTVQAIDVAGNFDPTPVSYTWTVEAANTAPVITSQPGADVEENQTSAIDVTATDDNDAEGAGLTYTITGGADQSLFAIDPATGLVTFTTSPDFETPTDADGDNEYQLQVTVSDSMDLTGMQVISIAVIDIDEASGFALSPPNLTAGIKWDVDPGTPGDQSSAPGISADSVEAVEAAFNNGRRQEETQLGLTTDSLGNLDLPAQAIWDTMTPAERALTITNSERSSRGGLDYPNHGTVLGLPLEAVESHLNKLAQDYADYMVDNNFWDNEVPASVTAPPFAGSESFSRISGHPVLGVGAGTAGADCHQLIARAENLYVTATPVANAPTPKLLIEKAIYGWIYDDASSAWGQREAIFLQEQTLAGQPSGFNNDRGPESSEGFMGIGFAGRVDGSFSVFSGTAFPSQWTVVWLVMDPSPDAGCNFGVPVTKELPNDTWQLISLPATPPASANTVADILGDDIPGAYDVTWKMWAFDELAGAAGEYVDPGINGVLVPGKAYWIKQISGGTVTLDMPVGSKRTAVDSISQCSAASPLGCFSYNLQSRGEVQWNMLGNPFYTRPSISNLRVSTTVGLCADTDGCSIVEAADQNGANVQHSGFWSYNGTAYVEIGPGDQMQPWNGYWNPVLSGAVDTNAVLRIPRK